MAGAALSENLKNASMSYYVVRRLYNTKEMVCKLGRKYTTEADKAIPDETVIEMFNTYNKKLARSGFEPTWRMETLKAGLHNTSDNVGKYIVLGWMRRAEEW